MARTIIALLALLALGAAALYADEPSDVIPPTNDRRAGPDWWSLQPIQHRSLPAVRDAKWAREPIDAFILAKLESQGLAPNPQADKRTLIRRVTFDLIGLPPTPAEVDAFVNDDLPDAYAKLVDRLLDSPHYGEQWARHWLDVVRFGESEGFEHNRPRPFAWRYRDWVVAAFNEDEPYDRFVRDQIAGDALSPGDPTALIATTYFNCGSYDSLGLTKGTDAMIEVTRLDHVEDVVGNLGQTFLGLTVNCARCHDHKFDPIHQKEYYQLAAALAGVGVGQRETLAESNAAAIQERRQVIAKRLADVYLRMQPLDGSIRERLGEAARIKAGQGASDAQNRAKAAMRAASETKAIAEAVAEEAGGASDKEGKHRLEKAREAEKKSAEEASKAEAAEIAAEKALAQLLQIGPARSVSVAQVLSEMPASDRPAYDPLLVEASNLEAGEQLLAGGAAHAVVSSSPATVHVLMHGDFRRPGETVGPRGLTAVAGLPPDLELPADAPDGPRRAKLAEWITDPRNPLPARVIVNRLWHYHFGAGLVRTPNDFGFNGGHPSHPELLDYLATQLMSHGWSLKFVQRMIVMSAAYQQSSAVGPSANSDPDNRLVWRRAPMRLQAESLRDAMLFVSGALNPQMGGPGYHDHEHHFKDDDDFYEPKDVSGPEFDRRSIYRTWNRAGVDPFLETMDCPDPSVATPARSVTTTPLQALSMLNGVLSTRLSAAFAKRVEREAGSDAGKQVETGYRLSFGRLPLAAERGPARKFVSEFGLQQLCLILFNSSEFLYVD